MSDTKGDRVVRNGVDEGAGTVKKGKSWIEELST